MDKESRWRSELSTALTQRISSSPLATGLRFRIVGDQVRVDLLDGEFVFPSYPDGARELGEPWARTDERLPDEAFTAESWATVVNANLEEKLVKMGRGHQTRPG